MTRHRLPRRPHPDRQGARACAEPRRRRQGQRAGLYRRCDGREHRRACREGRQLGLRGVPVFVFQEGRDRRRRGRLQGDRAAVERAPGSASTATRRRRWQDFCRPSRCLPTGGLKALEARGRPEDRLMIEHLRGGGQNERAARAVLGRSWCAGRCSSSFLRADAARLAQTLRSLGRCCSALVGGRCCWSAGPAIGGFMVAAALGLVRCQPHRRSAAEATPGRRSTVRTAALEMELDHDTGALEGLVLAGRPKARCSAR